MWGKIGNGVLTGEKGKALEMPLVQNIEGFYMGDEGFEPPTPCV
jgi:hypothetical protein